MVVEPTLIFNHLIIDTGKRKVYYNQQEVLLTTKEYELLYRLALYEGRVLSYRQLYEAVWGEDPMGNEANAVSCHVYGLRRKFREIEFLIVFSVAALYFAVVPWRVRTDEFMANAHTFQFQFKQRRFITASGSRRLVNSEPLSVWTHSMA